MPPLPQTLTATERRTQLAGLKKLLESGDADAIRQAVELTLSLGDGPLVAALAKGVSFSKTGSMSVSESALLQRAQDAWPEKTPWINAQRMTWATWRLAAAVGLFKGAERLDYDASGLADLSELRAGGAPVTP